MTRYIIRTYTQRLKVVRITINNCKFCISSYMSIIVKMIMVQHFVTSCLTSHQTGFCNGNLSWTTTCTEYFEFCNQNLLSNYVLSRILYRQHVVVPQHRIEQQYQLGQKTAHRGSRHCYCPWYLLYIVYCTLFLYTVFYKNIEAEICEILRIFLE